LELVLEAIMAILAIISMGITPTAIIDRIRTTATMQALHTTGTVGIATTATIVTITTMGKVT
jgi:hypothetical protein